MKLRGAGEEMTVVLKAEAGGQVKGEALIDERDRAGPGKILTAENGRIPCSRTATDRPGLFHPLNCKSPPILAQAHLPAKKLQGCMTDGEKLCCPAKQGQFAGKEMPDRIVFPGLQRRQEDKGLGTGPVPARLKELLVIKRGDPLQGMAKGAMKGTALIGGQTEGCFRPEAKQIFGKGQLGESLIEELMMHEQPSVGARHAVPLVL